MPGPLQCCKCNPLCDNLDNKIIEIINFIKIKIIVFYYRDNSKFLDITIIVIILHQKRI